MTINMVIAFLMMNPFHHKLYKGNYDGGGEYNGYVAFDEELPLSWQGGADFDDNNVLDHMVSVHGGITLDHSMSDWMDEPIIPLTAIPEPEKMKNFRVIGFDTLHYDDTKERWPLEAVKNETLDLMKQIEELLESKTIKEE